MAETWHFYALAVAIGLFQGGIQALSRSFYTRLIPEEQSAEFFGFFNLLGKFAAVIGPVLMGTVTLITGSNRLGNPLACRPLHRRRADPAESR